MADGGADESRQDRLKVAFERGGAFRVVAADGAFGGLRPDGQDLMMFLFHEHPPVPTGGLLAPSAGALEVQSASNVVYTVEVGVRLRLDAARRLRDWLTARLDEASPGG